jgi:cellulose synthase/poly-beta-1,6-N-acetylglucosamine synthase-like glycosyltransferase
MIDIIDTISDIFLFGIFIYSISIIMAYLILAVISVGESIKYIRKNSFIDYDSIVTSPLSPTISIIAPAYNEGNTIIENVRSLISLRYNFYEVILVNDGSKDDSLAKLIKAYDLELVDFKMNEELMTKPIRGIYRSRNPVFNKITVVDKENGGKADALNVGLNVAQNKLVACIDVDCILEQDSLLKMVKPFLEDEYNQVIAAGGVVRIANSCVIEDGRLVKVNLPDKFLPRVQTLEYIRAFLLGRMAWSRLNGLLLISGAFGLFDKRIAIACGGYNTKTVGEDMELVVRMRVYLHERNLEYKVVYIPDPLCWTEAPESFKILNRQRNRWTRGTAETLWLHRKIFFNPKFKSLGLVSYPYWFLYEWLAPIVEFFGILNFALLAFLGYVNWDFFIILLGLVISFAICFSMLAILAEELTYHQYKRKTDMFKLILTALQEPFFFHPFGTWSAIMGNIDLIIGKKNWGEMTRTGFQGKKK